MRNLLICEGSTDLVLIQYYLEKTTEWEYVKQEDYGMYDLNSFNKGDVYKWFQKRGEENYLCIFAAKGCSKIPKVLNDLWFLNKNQMRRENLFSKVIVITDNDEEDTEKLILGSVSEVFLNNECRYEQINSNEWNNINYNWLEEEVSISFLPMIIPFDTTGAIEDFLLQALKKKSEQEDPNKLISKIVDECSDFIENLDVRDSYLTKRRERTKAKFTSVFVVLTPADAYSKRKKLLQSVPWEEYHDVQHAFRELHRI